MKQQNNCNLLNNIANLKNKSIILRHLARLSSTEVNRIDINEINRRAEQEDHNRYFLRNMQEIEEHCDRQIAVYRWIDTGYKTQDTEPIWICLVKESGIWKKARVGTEQQFFAEASEKSMNPNTQTENIYINNPSEDIKVAETNKATIDEPKSDISSYEELKSYINPDRQIINKHESSQEIQLDTKESLPIEPLENIHNLNNQKEQQLQENSSILSMTTSECGNQIIMFDSWNTSHCNALDYYIQIICQRAEEISYVSNDDRIVRSTDGTVTLINTGLLNNLGQDMYIIYKKNGTEITDIKRVTAKSELMFYGFSKEAVKKNLLPVILWDDEKDLEFNGDELEDFDFQNRNMMNSAILSLRENFSVSTERYSMEALYNRIINSITLALKIHRRDKRYILPVYDPELKKINFIIPLHVDDYIDDRPEFALVIGDNDSLFYEIKEVIDLETAYIRAKTVNPYINSWVLP